MTKCRNHSLTCYRKCLQLPHFQIKLSVSNVTVMSGSNKTIDSDVLRVTTGGEDEIEFRILADPECGRIVRDACNVTDSSTLRHFTVKEVNDNQIYYINNPSSGEDRDMFTVAACKTGTQRCTLPKQVTVLIRYRNLYGKIFHTESVISS